MEVYVLLFIGILLAIIAIIIFTLKYNVYKNGDRIVGKIIDIKKIDEAIIDEFNQVNFITLYKPIIRFTAKDGEEIVFVHNNPGSTRDYILGEEIIIVCNKKNKNDFYVDEKMEFFKIPLIVAILSIIFLSFAFTLYIV